MLAVALGLLVYATTIPLDIQPLVPALQNNLLLTIHVAVASSSRTAPSPCLRGGRPLSHPEHGAVSPAARATELLDEIGVPGGDARVPDAGLIDLLGAVWAEIAWGSYWTWDPKETASLVTWLIYGGYLHARVMRGWRGQRSAYLLVAGFAATLFTYYGNLFFGGLHSYG